MAERMANGGPKNPGDACTTANVTAGNAGTPAAPVLAARIRDFTFHDRQVPVLRDVALSLAPGSFTAILGASGSGKSTLGRLLAGWLPPGGHGTLSGFLELSGTRLEFDGGPADPRIDPAQWGRHVGFVPQDPATVLSTVRATVAEELAFGLENAGMQRGSMQAAVQRTAGLLGLRGLLDQDPARLSGGQLRRLAIGCAIIADPQVLIMDEPFASLDDAGANGLAALVRDLLTQGTAVVILSQAVDPLLREAGTWTVLTYGRVTANGAPSAVGRDALPAAIRRRDLAAASRPVPRLSSRPAQPLPAEPAALELRNVSFHYPGAPASRRRRRRQQPSHRSMALQGVDLAVRPGEIVAVTGPNGAGKSTLLRHLNGLLQPTSGTVLVRGSDIAGSPVGQTAASVGLLFQQPRDQLFERTVLREVAFGLDRLVGHAMAGERAAAALRDVGLLEAAEEHP
ncbi:MAG: ABC transporter ATP-binding protein, partial [Actinomycetes bacterium]